MKNIFKYLIVFTIISNQFLIAQETEIKNPMLTSKFQLGVGIYIPLQNVKFSADGISDNQLIEFDENFDFNNNQGTLDVFFNWRFAKKWNFLCRIF